MNRMFNTDLVPIEDFAIFFNRGRSFLYRAAEDAKDRAITLSIRQTTRKKRMRARRPKSFYTMPWSRDQLRYEGNIRREVRKDRSDYAQWWRKALCYVAWWENVNLSYIRPRNPLLTAKVIPFPTRSLQEELDLLDAPCGDSDLKHLAHAEQDKRRLRTLPEKSAYLLWWEEIFRAVKLDPSIAKDEDFFAYLARNCGKAQAVKMLKDHLVELDYEAWLLREGGKEKQNRRVSLPRRILDEIIERQRADNARLKAENENLKAILAKSPPNAYKPRKKKPAPANSNVESGPSGIVEESRPPRERRQRYGTFQKAQTPSAARRG